ncbi:MAG: hypothetical protein N2249_03700 [Melioribacter sp.]|nr:hypothetical protein [Melioribacter sp.]
MKSVLVVESNTMQLRKLRELLSREGYDVITVNNIESAMIICDKVKVDYILASTEILQIKSKIENKGGNDVKKDT